METDQILSKTALKATAPEFVPSSLTKSVPEKAMATSTTKIDDKEVMPVVEVKPLPKPEVPETVPESPEDSDDDVHVVLRSPEVCAVPRIHPKLTATTNVVFHPPPMRHRDTTESIDSTDSERSVDSPVRDKDDSANLGDLSDSSSEAGSLPTHDACEAGDDESDDPEVPELSLRPEKVIGKVSGDHAQPASKEAVSTDDDLPPFVPPDEELAKKIVDQVEFYFSDVNITKDAFLLKHVKRNKEGYVSLKLISSFKRVKHIARDWRVVAYALKNSTKLEINEAGTKLRRVDPLPAYDQTTPSRTVVAINLPHDKPTIESVAELFRPCGDIALVRILRPGNPIPADVRSFVSKHPEMHGVVSALVEFVRTESALAAVAKRDWDWRATGDITAMRVLELNAPASPQAVDRIKKRNAANKKNILGKYAPSEYEYSSCASGSEAELEQRFMRSMQRRGSSPLDCGKHWLQRRYSRDSGCEDMGGYHRTPSSGSLYGRMSNGWDSGSEYSRSRSNSGASFDLGVRRMSAGWESGSESCCSGRSSRSNSAAFIMEGMTGRRFSAGKDSDSDGYGSFRSRKSSGASDMSSRRDSCSGMSTGRRNSTVHDEEGYLPPRRGSHQMHLEHQLLRRMTALGLGDPRDCCSCHCRPMPSLPPAHDCHGRRGSGDLQLPRKPVGFAPNFAPSFATNSAPNTPTEPVRRTSLAGMPENIMRMPRGPDGGRGFLRENDIPEIC